MTRLSLWRIGGVFLLAATAIAARGQTFTTLVDFDGTDGAVPYFMTLAQGPDGNLYGTTSEGGVVCNCGTIFKTTATGELVDFYSFCTPDCPGGSLPPQV